MLGQKYFQFKAGQYKPSATTWGAPFPNPADFNFNYRKLLDIATGPNVIAQNRNPNINIAVVGAGAAGLTVARELIRCGFTRVSIFEAGPIWGGRHDTKYLQKNSPSQLLDKTAFEGGAMRFPPFLTSSSGKFEDGASILSYYYKEFDLTGEAFPNPGSACATTGIYYNEGRLGDHSTPRQMAIWGKKDTVPPTADLKNVFTKWQCFVNRLIDVVSTEYVQATWPVFWKQFVSTYWMKTFRDVVLDAPRTPTDETPADFGGVGMTEDESNLFYLIGGGDGSWGAFYNLSFLYAYRTFVHGFGSDLYLLHGRFKPDGSYNPGPHPATHSPDKLTDSWGSPMSNPAYIGARSLDDCLLFMPMPRVVAASGRVIFDKSIYDFMSIREFPEIDVQLYLNTKINTIEYKSQPQMGSANTVLLSGVDPRNGNEFTEAFTDVVLTVPTWQFGTDINVKFMKEGSDPAYIDSKIWPNDLQGYFSRAHWEPALKVFVPLTQAYWEKKGNKIPQVFTSDTFIHDAYAYKAQGSDQAVLLVSYTWWRDATKLLSYEFAGQQYHDGEVELINKCVNELDRICVESQNIGQSIKDYITPASVTDGSSFVRRWEAEPNYKGAARLYDQREWMDTQLPMAYNQTYSANSNIYLAGESYSVDAGWTEPAFRTAIDTVLWLTHNYGTQMTPSFDFDRDYPRYDVNWRPSQSSKEPLIKSLMERV